MTVPQFIGMLLSAVINMLGTISVLYMVIDPTITPTTALKRANSEVGSWFWIQALVGTATLLGFILLIIPGIYVAVLYSFAVLVFFHEKIKGTAALTKSAEYVRGRWWSIAWRFIVLSFALFLVQIVVTAISALLGFFVDLSLATIIHFAFMWFFAALFPVMYFNNVYLSARESR